MTPKANIRPMLNAYPDSLGGRLGDIAALLGRDEVKGAFSSFYVLPSVFHSDLDRGFSLIDFELDERMADAADLDALRALGIDLKLDFVLNHLSVQSPQFQDILKNGNDSPYRDFFIDWNRFWEGHGKMMPGGYIQPDPELIRDMFFRKPGLPILMVRFPDGRDVPYWNTFYQSVTTGENGERRYLGQMDLNIRSEQVRAFYRDTLRRLAAYGAGIVRLDAFAYAAKEVGKRNFFNEPDTWELLDSLQETAKELNLELLPEIHASYAEGRYRQMSEQGYMTYDFFLPGLIIDALECGSGARLAEWAQELIEKKIRTVNMLGCHDGIPLLDLVGILPEDRIHALIDLIVSRGGYVKNLHGQKNVYYQVNATYFSALGEDEKKFLLARAIQLFMPGKPQVWYLDLFAGRNDLEAVHRAGEGGHKEINRTNLSAADTEAGLQRPIVQKQLELLKFRNACPAFDWDAAISVKSEGESLVIRWEHGRHTAELQANLKTLDFTISNK